MGIFRVSIIQLHNWKLKENNYVKLGISIGHYHSKNYKLNKQTCDIEESNPESEVMDRLSQLQRPAGPKSLNQL